MSEPLPETDWLNVEAMLLEEGMTFMDAEAMLLGVLEELRDVE